MADKLEATKAAEEDHKSIIPKVVGVGLVLAILVFGIIIGGRYLTSDEGWDYQIANDDTCRISIVNSVIFDSGNPGFTIVFHNMTEDRTVNFRLKDDTIFADDIEWGAFTSGGPFGPDGTETSTAYSAIAFNTEQELDLTKMKTIKFDIEVYDVDTEEVIATYPFRYPKES